MILIGSHATRHWFPDFPREPEDTDYLCEVKPAVREKRTEYLNIPPLFKYVQPGDKYISKDVLYTLKISHLFWNHKWAKNMFDVVFLTKKGCQLIEPLFQELYQHWCEVHGDNKRSNLKMTKEDFFNNAMKTYDHDYLHTLLNPTPTYQKVLVDGKEVEVDEAKFHALSFEDKLELAREEIYVMAYERLWGRDYREAYVWMLKKFIMNHAPMYEALFIIQNYIHLHKPLFNYKTKLDYELSRNQKQITGNN